MDTGALIGSETGAGLHQPRENTGIVFMQTFYFSFLSPMCCLNIYVIRSVCLTESSLVEYLYSQTSRAFEEDLAIDPDIPDGIRDEDLQGGHFFLLGYHLILLQVLCILAIIITSLITYVIQFDQYLSYSLINCTFLSSLHRCFLGEGRPAQWPNASWVVEAICLALCRIYPAGQTVAGVCVNR